MKSCKNSEESAPDIVRRFCPHGEGSPMNGCTVLVKPEGCCEWQPFVLSFDGPENS